MNVPVSTSPPFPSPIQTSELTRNLLERLLSNATSNEQGLLVRTSLGRHRSSTCRFAATKKRNVPTHVQISGTGYPNNCSQEGSGSWVHGPHEHLIQANARIMVYSPLRSKSGLPPSSKYFKLDSFIISPGRILLKSLLARE
jgi:hypothetical protein